MGFFLVASKGSGPFLGHPLDDSDQNATVSRRRKGLAPVSAVVLLALCSMTGHAEATDVETADGRHFSNCSALKADSLGIYFRHSKGIAKENFWVLSDAIRENFENAEDAPGEKGKGNADAKAQPAGIQLSEIVLTFAIRQPIATQPCFDPCYLAYHHPYHPNPLTWPKHWHRFHHAHYLTNPHYRALATRNFLYNTGLLRPFGPVHHQFRY